ncbi:MAG: hypothetical protein LLG04_15675 [Parachlamydia sp.]|nr:hypothetical protein [Parachlamydia sp.]
MGICKIGQLTADSWVRSSDRLLTAYRQYSTNGSTCSKGRLLLGATVNAVYAVALAAFSVLGLVIYCASLGHVKNTELFYACLHADLTTTSLAAFFRFKPTMEKLRALEAKCFCRTLLSIDVFCPLSQGLLQLTGNQMPKDKMEKGLIDRINRLDAKQLSQTLTLDLVSRAPAQEAYVRLLSVLHAHAKESLLPILDGKISEMLKKTVHPSVRDGCLDYYLKASKRAESSMEQEPVLAALDKSSKRHDYMIQFLEHYLSHNISADLIRKIAQQYRLEASDDEPITRAWENCQNQQKRLAAMVPLYQMRRRPLHNLDYHCPRLVDALLTHARNVPYEPLLYIRLDECIRPRTDARGIVLETLQLALQHRLPLLRDRVIEVILINAKTLGQGWLELQPNLIAQGLQETGRQVIWDPNKLGSFRDMHEVHAYYSQEALALAQYAVANPGTPLAEACQAYIRRNSRYLEAVRSYSPQEQQMFFQPLFNLGLV